MTQSQRIQTLHNNCVFAWPGQGEDIHVVDVYVDTADGVFRERLHILTETDNVMRWLGY